MCDYVGGNKCNITNDVCPFIYWCNKVNDWRPLSSMPNRCKRIDSLEAPEGFYKVRQSRKQWLYVDIENETIMIKNPYDEVPALVKVEQNSDTYKIIDKK